MPDDAFTDRIEAAMAGVPPPPEPLTAALDILASGSEDADPLCNALDAAPALAEKILHLAASPYFEPAAVPGSVREAAEILGLRRLLQLAMAVHAGTILNRPVPGYDLPAGELRRHAIGVAIAAETAVRRLEADDDGLADLFIAAIFHDIGKLVLGPLVAEHLSAIEAITAGGESFEVAERRVLSTDHAEVGSRILARWGFPEGIVRAVRWSHAPDEVTPADRGADVLHVANVLCLSIGIGVGKEELRYKTSPAAQKRIGATTVHLEWIASHTLQWINDLSQRLTFHTPTGGEDLLWR